MKDMKKQLILLAASMTLLCSCKDEVFYEDPYGDGVSSADLVGHEEIILGEKLEDPYSVKNITKALASLYPTKAGYLDLRPTNVYVRFLPENDGQYKALVAAGLELIDHPVDYAILQEGDYYHDPDIDDDDITWQYTVVPSGTKFPEGIRYEILDDCYIPDEESTKGPDGIDWKAVEKEAFRITGNESLYLLETKGAKVHPEGRITIEDDRANGGKPFGVAGVKVLCNSFVKFSSAYTDRDGYYSIPQSYSSKLRYRLVFKNKKGFAIGFNLVLVPASMSTLGRGTPEGVSYNVTKDSESKLFRRCVVNNAAYDYFERCSENDMDIMTPPSNLRIWIFKGMKFSSSVMMHHGAFLSDSLVQDFLGQYAPLVQLFLPDITIGTKGAGDYASLYALTVHEMAHASHFSKVGTDYWNHIIRYMIKSFVSSGDVDYGDGNESDAGYCEIGEMWAYFMEAMMFQERYGGNIPNFGTSFWFHPQILTYLAERGMTRSEIFSALDADVHGRMQLHERLINLFPDRKTTIDQVFSRYN